MTPALLVTVLGGIAVSATGLGILGLVVFRELRRALDFDRRLGVPRSRALGFGLGAAPRAREQRREARALGLALLRAGSLLVPVGAGERDKLAALLRQAGFAQPDALSYFLSLKLAGAALLGAGAGLWGQGSALLGAHTALLAFTVLAGLVVGGIVPEYLLRALVARRLRGMARALPDALDLMVMCLESGLTFERALLTVAVELAAIEPDLAAEFRQIEAELRVGADRRAVLQAFHRRTAVEGLRDMAMTLIQSERFGTPLAQAMRNIAANERLQRAARAAARADRLPVLMTLPMLLFVVPGTLLLVAGPAFLGAIEALESSAAGSGAPDVGGNMFQVFGVLNEYFKRRGNITEADLGRYNVTGNVADRHSFKAPSLRMAAPTAPYLHDGSAATLRGAVDAMFEFQLGREAPEEDKEAIVAFIRTLAGESEELSP